MKYKVLYQTLSSHRSHETKLVKAVIEKATALYLQINHNGEQKENLSLELCNELCIALENLQGTICQTDKTITRMINEYYL